MNPNFSVPLDDHWAYYNGSAFVEYRLSRAVFTPFFGSRLGMQGYRLSYLEVQNGSAGSGDYGLSLGLYGGVLYRTGKRFGAVVRFGGDYAPSLEIKGFMQAQIGLATFL